MKHTGLHAAKKIVIVLHKLEAEPHMCLVMYSDKLPPLYHDTIMKLLTSEKGQASKDFSSALENEKLPDGRALAFTLHQEGHFKKVPTNQVFATPDTRNKIRLDELNDYLTKIDEGGEALKKLQEREASMGMNVKKTRKQVQEELAIAKATVASATATSLEANQTMDSLSKQLATLVSQVSELTVKVEKLTESSASAKTGRKAKKS